LGWKQVIYSFHEYGVEGNDFNSNKATLDRTNQQVLNAYLSFNIPVYIGEFMAQENGETLAYLLNMYNNAGYSWSSWTYKSVNLGAWGLTNLPGTLRVNVANDSYDTILNAWNNMPSGNPESAMVSAMTNATH
jgi:hypothetical protein